MLKNTKPYSHWHLYETRIIPMKLTCSGSSTLPFLCLIWFTILGVTKVFSFSLLEKKKKRSYGHFLSSTKWLLVPVVVLTDNLSLDIKRFTKDHEPGYHCALYSENSKIIDLTPWNVGEVDDILLASGLQMFTAN